MGSASVRRMLRGGIAERGLSAHKALALLALIDRSNADGVAGPSQCLLSEDLGIARPTVQAALGRLLAIGGIVEEEPVGRGVPRGIVRRLSPGAGREISMQRPLGCRGVLRLPRRGRSLRWLKGTGSTGLCCVGSLAARRSPSGGRGDPGRPLTRRGDSGR